MFRKLIYFFKYYKNAQTIYTVHSPFLYAFVENVLDISKQYYAFNHLEHERKILLKNKKEINIIDYGAGSKVIKSKKATIGKIAKTAMSSPKKCRLLFNLVVTYKPKVCIELGTSLGLSTLYMAKANKDTKIYTIEGNPDTYHAAFIMIERNNCPNVFMRQGKFDEQLPKVLAENPKIDMAYIDGNHTYEATIRYKDMLKNQLNEEGFLIFDDIYWSEGMKKAWDEIQKDPTFSLCIDLFDVGIAFKNSKLSKENVALIDYKFKPFKIGVKA